MAVSQGGLGDVLADGVGEPGEALLHRLLVPLAEAAEAGRGDRAQVRLVASPRCE